MHGLTQGLTRYAFGGRYRDGFVSGFFSSLAGSIGQQWGDNAGFLAATVAGGASEAIAGGNFADGALTGAYVYLFNHMADLFHRQQDGINISLDQLGTIMGLSDEAINQMKMQSIIKTIPILDGSGKAIGALQVYGKEMHAKIKLFHSTLKVLSVAALGLSLTSDALLLTRNEIGVGRFLFRSTGNISAWAVGASAGGVAGLVIVSAFKLGEASYNSIQELNRRTQSMIRNGNPRNRIRSKEDLWYNIRNIQHWRTRN